MLTLGKTGFGTSGCLCRINRFGVTECVYNSLRYKNLVTYGTVLAFGKTGVNAICSYCRINYLGVSERVYNSLRYENLAASSTMLTLGKTCVNTICSYCLVNNLGVNVRNEKCYLCHKSVMVGEVICIIVAPLILTDIELYGSEVHTAYEAEVDDVIFAIANLRAPTLEGIVVFGSRSCKLTIYILLSGNKICIHRTSAVEISCYVGGIIILCCSIKNELHTVLLRGCGKSEMNGVNVKHLTACVMLQKHVYANTVVFIIPALRHLVRCVGKPEYSVTLLSPNVGFICYCKSLGIRACLSCIPHDLVTGISETVCKINSLILIYLLEADNAGIARNNACNKSFLTV